MQPLHPSSPHAPRERRAVDPECDTQILIETPYEIETEVGIELVEEIELVDELAPVDGIEPPVEIELLEAIEPEDEIELLDVIEPPAGPAPQPDPWLVEGRLPSLGSSLLLARRGAGGSALTRELALAVARGERWLDFGTRRGPVLWVSLERKLAALREPFVDQGLRAGDDVIFMDERPEAGLLARIPERAREVKPALVVIDSVERLLRAGSAAGTGEPAATVDWLLGLPHRLGAHVLLVHGLRPGVRDRDLGTQLARLTREVDSILVLGRSASASELRTIQRLGDDLAEPVRVPSRRGRPRSQGLRQDRAEEAPALSGRVLRVLRDSERLLTSAEIAGRAGLEHGAVVRTLAALKRSARVVETGTGTHADPCRYTGCDPLAGSSSWLRRVQPWIPIAGSR